MPGAPAPMRLWQAVLPANLVFTGTWVAGCDRSNVRRTHDLGLPHRPTWWHRLLFDGHWWWMAGLLAVASWFSLQVVADVAESGPRALARISGAVLPATLAAPALSRMLENWRPLARPSQALLRAAALAGVATTLLRLATSAAAGAPPEYAGTSRLLAVIVDLVAIFGQEEAGRRKTSSLPLHSVSPFG